MLGSTRLLKAFAEASGLSNGAKLCYLLMCGYGRDSGECYASASTLAKALRTARRRVKRYWRQLRQAGFITSRHVSGKATHHLFLWHPVYAAVVVESGVPKDPTVGSLRTPGGVPRDTHMYWNYGMDVVQQSSSDAVPFTPTPKRSGKAPAPETTTTKTFLEVRMELWGYFQGERRQPVLPPDPDIVDSCLRAMRGHSVDELRALLRDRFRRGYRPGTPEGPDDYPWFVKVIRNHFSRLTR